MKKIIIFSLLLLSKPIIACQLINGIASSLPTTFKYIEESNESDLDKKLSKAMNHPSNIELSKQLSASLIKGIHKMAEDFYTAIPELSQSKNKWLDKELNTKKGFEYFKTWTYIEFKQREAKRHYKNILYTSELIIDKKFKTKKEEMAIWFSLSELVKNRDYIQNSLELHKKQIANLPIKKWFYPKKTEGDVFFDKLVKSIDISIGKDSKGLPLIDKWHKSCEKLSDSILDGLIGPYLNGYIKD